MAVKPLKETGKKVWEAFIAALGKPEGEIADKLAPLVGDIDDDAIDLFGNEQDTPTTRLLEALNGAAPEAKINRAIRLLRPVPAPVTATVPPPSTPPASDPLRELGENEKPNEDDVKGFASHFGMDPMMLMMWMGGGANSGMDISGMIPVRAMVDAYNPKKRDMILTVMGQVESRMGVPIIVIDGDGAINRALTVEYIEGLEEGREAAPDNIYFDDKSVPHEVIRVGVDAQSIYDADPLDPTKALQKNGMGTGRINWNKVSLEVRQVAFYAATRTQEINPGNEAHLSWLRDHIKPDANRLVFHGQAPRAIAEFNEAARTGSLPTLRVMLSRSPRRPETGPRRRTTTPQDLSDRTAPTEPGGRSSYGGDRSRV